MKKFNIALVTGLSALALSACSGSETAAPSGDDTTTVEDMPVEGGDAMPTAEENIVQIAQGNPATSTLVAAVTAAGLGETLSGTGPFTVFAPTNDAFGKVDKATLDGLMKPESKDALGGILKYHVVAGNVMAADVVKMITDGGGKAMIKTLNGELTATMDGDKVVLTDANGGKSTITGTDIKASNGVIHTIDTVVMPKS
ncbi:fasciclin domain-containing protein [Sphingorhabdus arenilitoris]|uniref:Fasciclin domain-containing protein n=1 Tax=Sphingorhabdus arenilitoris TaxID=1490041 RepID=A0ABV8RHR6_9SPHN